MKLKDISYVQAEAYPAGELKHRPLALVTEAMRVVVVAPNDTLIEKLKSNLQEVRARGGELFVFADADSQTCFIRVQHSLKLNKILSVIADRRWSTVDCHLSCDLRSGTKAPQTKEMDHGHIRC